MTTNNDEILDPTTRYTWRKGTAARWIEVNPVLRAGEPGYETDTGFSKVGDGVSLWSVLDYTSIVYINALLDYLQTGSNYATAAAAAATSAASSARSAAASAELAQLIADIDTPDDTMTAIDFDATSDFRQQQDPRHVLLAANRRRSGAELLRHHMATGTTCNWVHIGDSTGNESDEWLRMAIAEWATDYPNQRVIVFTWDDASQAYDDGVTVQPGAGSQPTLRVFNGSMPGGSFVSYFDSRVDEMVLVPLIGTEGPDLLTISSCHNDAGGSLNDYLIRMDAFVAGVRDTYPEVAVAVSSQNPEFSPRDPDVIAGNILRNRALRGHAIEKGWGYIPGFEQFWHLPDFGLSYVEADGVHPTDFGNRVWANAGIAFLRGDDVTSPRLEDTGWRLLNSGTIGVLNGFKIAARRTGQVVQVLTAQTGAGATGDGAEVVATLTPGFRPADPIGMNALPATIAIGADTLPIVGASLFVDATGTITVNAKNSGRHYCNLTFTTTESWPAILPGTPA